MSHHVFVYGTLMRGEPNSYLLSTSVFISTAFVVGYEMRDTGWGFPGIVEAQDPDLANDSLIVFGEVYRVTDATLAALDRLEGCPHLYTRETVTVCADGHSGADDPYVAEQPACAYVMTQSTCDRAWRSSVIASGDWRQHLLDSVRA